MIFYFSKSSVSFLVNGEFSLVLLVSFWSSANFGIPMWTWYWCQAMEVDVEGCRYAVFDVDGMVGSPALELGARKRVLLRSDVG